MIHVIHRFWKINMCDVVPSGAVLRSLLFLRTSESPFADRQRRRQPEMNEQRAWMWEGTEDEPRGAKRCQEGWGIHLFTSPKWTSLFGPP